MAIVTIQVLEGLERGEVFEGLETPVTIGREDDNIIRLNDERVSRFHAKIQDDGNRVILTDLDSTNGTRVNGHPISMRVLQYGDQVTIGRCLLVYGSDQQIAGRLQDIQAVQTSLDSGERTMSVGSSDGSDRFGLDDERGPLFPLGAPELPSDLRGVQKAQLSDLIAFAHDRIRAVLEAAVEEEDGNGEEGAPPTVQLDWGTWQRLLSLEMSLARYLRQVADPDE